MVSQHPNGELDEAQVEICHKKGENRVRKREKPGMSSKVMNEEGWPKAFNGEPKLQY